MNKSKFLYFLSFGLLLVLSLNCCSKINLTTNSDRKLPTLKGEWNVDFTYNDEVLNSVIDFNQTGNQISGEGQDLATGQKFTVDQGSLNGDQVKFQKRYITADPSHQPLQYTGKIEYLNIPEYKGWAMSGNYSTVVAGQPVTGNWESTPKNGNSQPAPVSQAPEALQNNASPQNSGNPEPKSHANNGNENEASGPDLSGRYDVSYAFDFKMFHSKMWIEQDGNNLLGHGVDTNTNEKFVIQKGWYHYPDVTIIRKYAKGKDAASSRTVIFKATVSTNSHGPHLKGQTQFGGAWEAQIIR